MLDRPRGPARARRIVGRLTKAAVLAVLLACASAALAQNAPQPPGGRPPQPAYARVSEPPSFRVWGEGGLASWIPPACTGWTVGAGNLVVALAGTFNYAGSADGLLDRFGAVSAASGIRYWSVTDNEWRDLITESAGIDGPESKRRRPDFTASEMKLGRDLYFVQRDSRATGEIVYKMRVREASADHIVVEMENVTPVRKFIVTIFGPGEIKFLYFLDRRAGRSWGLFALLSAKSSFADSNAASFVNRAAAFYRHFTGVPTDGAPPLAR